jgi:hypothetical protein
LAKSDPYLLIGDELISWQSFYPMVDRTWDEWFKAELVMTSFQTFSRMDQRTESLVQMRRDHASQISPKSLYHFLYMSQYAVSADPRDNIYGLLGIFDSMGQYSVMPNYSKSVQKVFTEATVTSILQHSTIPYLDFSCDHTKDYSKVPGLPSWVIDFTVYSEPLVVG